MKFRLTALLGVMIGTASTAHACAVCFGDGTSSMARAIWPGVYLLLGLVGLVFIPIIWMGISWSRRERAQGMNS